MGRIFGHNFRSLESSVTASDQDAYVRMIDASPYMDSTDALELAEKLRSKSFVICCKRCGAPQQGLES